LTVAGVLFDLDGTLVDTAPDLVAVLNGLLAEHDEAPMAYAIARNEASNGALGLIRLGFGASIAAERRESLRARFLEIYGRNVHNNSRLFIDISALIKDILDTRPWGVVTNKPHAMTVPLLEQLGLAKLAGCIVSGDSIAERKPHPAPLLLAAERLGVDPAQCVYIGDAVRDIEAGRAAGMRTVAALWGYIHPAEDPKRWAADACVQHPRQLAGILSRWIRGANDGAR
jgi:phosphoglycolate phosphatase